ncbi:hypothetical protein CFC21_014440 [Triticum aestivum]|uniref:MHD domain-containing protein n=2 Tax=Triticum aestivum TaxID=4565 RepID=A0A9R1IZ46_WHEAT|nr:uncharacterized protein LOC123186958 [Triticum aestivum]KAF6998315.1 hypothetical protein CFC21_014440 [Triticum aestivum]
MACLAISLQPVNGPDILLQTRSWFPVSRALAAVSAFRLARLSLARGKQHPSSSSSASLDAIGDDPLATGSGQLVVGVESQYRVVYRLVNSIYVLGVTTASDHAAPAVHAFAVADAVNQAVSVLVAACRGVDATPEKVHRKYPEVYLALDLVLHGVGSVRLSQILATIHGDNLARMVNSSPDAEARARGADSWPVVEHLAQDRHAARDGFATASFELPQETLSAGDEFSASSLAPATAAATGDEPPPEEAPPVEKDPFAASDMVASKPEEALVGAFKKNKETALVVADPAAALAGLEVTTLPPAEATKPTFIGVEGFEGDYGGIEFGNEEASLAEAFEGFNAPFGGGLDASEFVTTTKKDHKDKTLTGLEILAMSGGQAPNAPSGSPLDSLVTPSKEMTVPELCIVEEINAEFNESVLARVGLKGTIILQTLPPKKAAGREAEFSFRLEGTSGMKRAALQSTVLSSLENGLFHVKTPSKEEPIPIMKYSFLPKHSPLPLRLRLVKRHSGTLLSLMIHYASNPMLPRPLSNVTFIVKLPVDPTLLNVSPKAVLNRAERELRWHISDIPLKGPAGRLRARMPVDQDSKDGELEVVGMVKFAYQGPFTLSGIKLCPAINSTAQFNEVGHTFSSGSYRCI